MAPWDAHDVEMGAAVASDPEGTHVAVAPWGAHDGEVAAAKKVDLGGHERGSISLRCTRQRPLKVRKTVRWERLRHCDDGSRGHMTNDGTPKACMTARWEQLLRRISRCTRARVNLWARMTAMPSKVGAAMADFPRRERRWQPPLDTKWWRIPDARRRFRRAAVLFLCYFVYIFMPMPIGFTTYISVHGSSSIYLSVYNISIHILCKRFINFMHYLVYLIQCVLGSYHLFYMYNRNLEKGNRYKKWGHLPWFNKSCVCRSISFSTHILAILNLCTCSRKQIFTQSTVVHK
jgi:hypothetical protein